MPLHWQDFVHIRQNIAHILKNYDAYSIIPIVNAKYFFTYTVIANLMFSY